MKNIPDARSFCAVAFDLDDTLLRDDLSISPETLFTLRKLASYGMKVIPASGRSKMSIKPFVDRIAVSSVYISCNGAELWDSQTHNLLHSEKFSPELGREIARFGKAWNCYAQTYTESCFYYNEHSVWAERYASASLLSGVYVGDLEAFIQEPRNKILMMADESQIASMLQEARRVFQGRASVTCSKPYFLEFNPLQATKGIALEAACRWLGIQSSQVISFGDGLNDLPMLETSGWSVAMENGRDELKQHCDDCCLSNQDDGVSRYLREFFRGVFF